MNFKLIIQGFGDDTVLRIAGFDSIENYDIISKSNYLPLFLGYSDNNIQIGEKIKTIVGDKELLFTDLEIVSVFLGFGKPIENIPKGFKSIVLIKGKVNDISNLKKILPKIKHWNQTSKDYIALGMKIRLFKNHNATKWHRSIAGNKFEFREKIITSHYKSHFIDKENPYHFYCTNCNNVHGLKKDLLSYQTHTIVEKNYSHSP
jgi:hypothetical protein